jgi:hypothetical protein
MQRIKAKCNRDIGRIVSRRVTERSNPHNSFDMKLRHEPNEASVSDKNQALKVQLSRKI